MNKRPTERPEDRVEERGKKSGGYEKMRKDGERQQIKLPRPKYGEGAGRAQSMCVWCGRLFKPTGKNRVTCPSCSTHDAAS